MKILGQRHLTKLKKKNKGNIKLFKAIDKLTEDLLKARWKNKKEVLKARVDADCVHNDGFYFFDINVHRTFILIEYQPAGVKEVDENGDEIDLGVANILWVGTHDDYERVFNNEKVTIEKWLRSQGYIE